MIDSFDCPEIWAPFGAFSHAVVQGDGRIVHLKGQVALAPDGSVVAPGEMRGQVERVLENIRLVLGTVGGCMTDIQVLVQHVTDIDAFAAAGDIRERYFRPPYPATTTVEVVRLFRPELTVEITATAEIPRSRFVRPPSPLERPGAGG